ncbi:unnamed protein product [Aspergillus oryzae]|nr:unnamed protein product [Aspergillus oryzae]GMF84030.1 unnamed protein product [Aspergillus oryzae]
METAQGITTIRAFGWTTQKLEHNHYLLDQSQRPSYLLGVIQFWLLLTANLITTGIATSLTVLATQLRTDPGFTGASAVTLMTFSGLVTIFIRDYTAFETSLGAVSRLKSLSDNVKAEAREGEDLHPDEQWPKKGSIEIERLSASYDPSAKLTIDDIPIQHVDRSTLRERIIGVPQDAVFLPNGNTVKDNLDPSGLATEDECLSVLSTVNLDGLANGSHGLHTPLTTNHLSGGQKKLFGLGRAILRRIIRDRATTDTESHGGILILDEISSGVDAATERTMHEIISHQFADYTVLEVVHGLDIVPHFFDRVIVIENGSIVESGSPAELLQRPSSWFKQLLLMNSACDQP